MVRNSSVSYLVLVFQNKEVAGCLSIGLYPLHLCVCVLHAVFSPSMMILLASTEINTGRYKLAERDLTRALELNPNFADAKLNLDQVKADMERGHKFNEADKFVENSSAT